VTIKEIGQSAAKPQQRNVQRLSRKGVRPSGWKRMTSIKMDDDIVYSIAKVIAVLKGRYKINDLMRIFLYQTKIIKLTKNINIQ
jgi:hypothetical protein